MLNFAQANIQAIKKIALALEEINLDVVYVGGAVVFLYVDNPSVEDARPTMDVDIVVQISSLRHLEEIREKLIKKGFCQTWEDHIICRFRYDDIKVDVMSTTPIGWAPGNQWFEKGFDKKISYNIDGVNIYILPVSYYLATKFSAFYDRGELDPRTSHDLEDIVYLLDNSSLIKREILSSPSDLKTFINKAFNEILNSNKLKEAIIGNLYFDNQMVRFNKIIQTLTETVESIK
jgi:hypothetical protein